MEGTTLPAPLSRYEEAMRRIFKREETNLIVVESPDKRHRLEVLVEPLIPNPILYIAGGGHIGQALAVQADLIGFDIAVLDDRPEYTSADLYPRSTTRCGPIDEELKKLPIGGDAYVVIVTRDHQRDARRWRPAFTSRRRISA